MPGQRALPAIGPPCERCSAPVVGGVRGREDDGMDLVVGAERLGWPGPNDSALERAGVVQRRLVYEVDPATPTATCHLQPGSDLPAVCGFPWEALERVPGDPTWESIPAELRCSECTARRREE